MARLLVTGGAGFVGANFVRYWHARNPGDRLVVLDALTYAGRRDRLAELEGSEAFRFVHGDIRDREGVERLLAEEDVDTIVHFAAESHVDRSIQSPDAFVATNVVGTQALLDAARAVWLDGTGRPHRFHHVSTDEVFGSLTPSDAPFTEASPHRPNSPYSASKAGSDHLVRAYHRTFGLQTSTTHCTNNYGPFQFPEKLVSLFLVNILRGLPLPLYGDGRHVRDWLFVEDHCRALELVLRAGHVGTSFVVGGRCEQPNVEVVRTLCDVTDRILEEAPDLLARFPDARVAAGGRSQDLIRFVADRPGHDRRYAVDCSRIEEHLGYRPAWTLEDGLEATVRWYLTHEAWWRPLLETGPATRPESSRSA